MDPTPKVEVSSTLPGQPSLPSLSVEAAPSISSSVLSEKSPRNNGSIETSRASASPDQNTASSTDPPIQNAFMNEDLRHESSSLPVPPLIKHLRNVCELPESAGFRIPELAIVVLTLLGSIVLAVVGKRKTLLLFMCCYISEKNYR